MARRVPVDAVPQSITLPAAVPKDARPDRVRLSQLCKGRSLCERPLSCQKNVEQIFLVAFYELCVYIFLQYVVLKQLEDLISHIRV